MAGERKGKVFEIITYLALSEIGYELERDLFWGTKPEGFSVDPDFILGSLDKPSHWLLLTSSGSAKEFDKKFWRNIAELFEVKRHYDNPPIVISMSLESLQLKGLQAALSKVFDFDFKVSDQEYGKDLIDNLDTLLEGKLNKVRLDYRKIKDEIDNNESLRTQYEKYKGDLIGIIGKKHSSLDGLWELAKSRVFDKNIRKAKSTYLRRGIAKMLLLDNLLVEEIFSGSKLRISGQIHPHYLFDIGITKKSIKGYVLADEEIGWCFDNLNKNTIEYLISASPVDKMKGWIGTLKNIKDVDKMLAFVIDNYSILVTKNGMLECMREQHDDPCYGINRKNLSGNLTTVWIIYFIFDLIKAHRDKKQGYGRSFLAKEAQKYIENKNYPPTSVVWGGLGISQYINRSDKANFPEDVIIATASVLSDVLGQISKVQLEKLLPDVKQAVITSNLNQKLIPYWLFQPLLYLLEFTLNRKKIHYEVIKNFPSFIGEYIGNTSVVTTPVIVAKNTLIHWKSAYDLGKHHKTKELSGRVQSMRYEYKDKFRDRVGIMQYILVLDGTFTDIQIETLSYAGWDEIFYPDEMDKLAKAIV